MIKGSSVSCVRAMTRATFGLAAAGFVICAIAMITCGTARAQDDGRTHPRPRVRVVVHPGRMLYRECTSWLQPKVWPDGHPVVVPQMHCDWVVR